MSKEERIPISFGEKSFIFLDFVELSTWKTILIAMMILRKEGYENYSTTRLIKKSFEQRINSYITENRIRRMIMLSFGSKPALLKVKQRGRLRLLSPTNYAKDKFLSKS